VLIIDTNLWVSFALFPDNSTGKMVGEALDFDDIIFSKATFAELAEVLRRDKFNRYVSLENREGLLSRVADRAVWIDERTLSPVTDCRDVKDNKFLELALACDAEYLVTGDQDLLVLDPYNGTRIVTVVKFAEVLKGGEE